MCTASKNHEGGGIDCHDPSLAVSSFKYGNLIWFDV